MIDAHDPREDPKNNDILTELVQTLKGMENKLRDFIAKQSDEEVLNFVLELNDDLNKTFERYKAIRQGQKPKPFIPSGVEYTIEREDKKAATKSQPKPSVQDDLLDLLGDTNLNQGQTQQQTTNNTMKYERFNFLNPNNFFLAKLKSKISLILIQLLQIKPPIPMPMPSTLLNQALVILLLLSLLNKIPNLWYFSLNCYTFIEYYSSLVKPNLFSL